MAEATTDPVRLPPGPRIPKAVQGVGFLAARHRAVAALARRYGGAFTLNLPIFGETVVISDPALDQGSVHHQQRSRRAGRPISARARSGLDVQPRRRRAPCAAQAARPAVPRQADGRLRSDHRRRGDARDRELARGPGVRNAAADDAHHPQRHPAYGVRRRRAPRSTNCANCSRRWSRWPREWR